MDTMQRCIQCAGLFPEESFEAQRALCIYCARPKPIDVGLRRMVAVQQFLAIRNKCFCDLMIHGNALFGPPIPPHYPLGHYIPMPDVYTELEKVPTAVLHIRNDITEGITVESCP